MKNNSFNYINNCTNKDKNYTIQSDSLTNIKNKTQLYENTNASLDTNSNQSFDIEYDNNIDFHDIDCEINETNDLDIEYDINQNNVTPINKKYIMDYEDCIDSKLICEDEYFENEWK
ncbi:hypothetical protein SH2C18_38750 [Clostridium sediminicola]|uniref:hypothetical protein n=1 Tax=Clostridium sediminicola TaxID=3114879 RepID=UPI0031F21360